MRVIQSNNSCYQNERSDTATFEFWSSISMIVEHPTELALW